MRVMWVILALARLPDAWPWSLLLAAIVLLFARLRSPVGVAFVLGVAWAWFNAAHDWQMICLSHSRAVDLLVSGYVASLPDATGTDPQFDFDISRRLTGGCTVTYTACVV